MEEKGDRGQKECHKDVIRSNERKSKMPVSVKGEWKKGLREKEGRGGEREREREKKRREKKERKKRRELGRGNARMS